MRFGCRGLRQSGVSWAVANAHDRLEQPPGRQRLAELTNSSPNSARPTAAARGCSSSSIAPDCRVEFVKDPQHKCGELFSTGNSPSVRLHISLEGGKGVTRRSAGSLRKRPGALWKGVPVRLADLTPERLRCLSDSDLGELAEDIRQYLITTVSRTGGHLGPNLGVVELTLALHRVFHSPATPILFDVGHQSYVHKLVTGRAVDLPRLRSADGPSGYPRRTESPHDVIENSHASTALGYADGLSRAFELQGKTEPVVAVIGDGAMTGGPAWEGLNNLAVARRPVVIVLNDNASSYAPTVGGLARHLARISDRRDLTDLVEDLGGTRVPSAPARYESWFGSLGLDYIGPIDGHDLGALETVFREVSTTNHPVVVHVLTQKGHGHPPAEADQIDHMHTVPPAPDPASSARTARPTWTDVCSTSLVGLAGEHPELVAITAAMAGPTGLQRMADAFPSRVVDVGICEAQAVISAAGLAMGGMHPVVALYASFANRAFDQALLDVGLHQLGVTFVLDRAGITGPDGPSHHGMWDLALFSVVPGMRIGAPRDAEQLEQLLAEAVGRPGPTMVRFPKSAVGEPITSVGSWGDLDVLRWSPSADVLVVAVGPMARPALEAADLLTGSGIECNVVDPRWVVPTSPHLIPLAARHRLVVTVEDGVRRGGIGAQIGQVLADANVGVAVRALGLPSEFVGHGSREALLAENELDESGIAMSILDAVGDRRRPGRRPPLRIADGSGRRRTPLFVLESDAARGRSPALNRRWRRFAGSASPDR